MPPQFSQELGGAQSQKLIARLGADSMGRMGYDAIGVGGIDFLLGAEFLKKIASGAGTRFVTTNLLYRDSMQPFGSKYAIINAGDIRVGVLSVLPVDAFDKISDRNLVENLDIIPPERAIGTVLPQIKEKTDIVILLSQCGQEMTRLIVKGYDGIDLCICCGDERGRGGCGEKRLLKGTGEEKTSSVIMASYRGERLGYASLDLNTDRQATMSQSKMIRLDKSIPADEEIVKITGKEMFDKVKEEKQKEEFKRTAELRKLSPVEYLEMLKKQSASGGKKK